MTSGRQPQYQPGQIIPGTVYRVHRVVGAGGMGTVYDVEDTTVGKRYVLKTLHANLADRDDLAGRLLREARALARMHHPSIIEVFTAGTTGDHLKLPYYVMEKLNGQSLRQVLSRKGRLEIDQALDIGIDLLDALDHAHELGMIHRDVKPDNIYLHKAIDGSHVAKLLDFGIAKVVASSTQLTGGRFIGTFRYASPEQITGGDLTTQSDLYSAGLTIYEMIAGRGPFDDFAGDIEIGKAHATVAAPRISRFVKVPPQLDDLIASALDKRAAQRPKDAFKFASVLRELKQSMRSPSAAAPESQQITAKPIATSAPTAIAPEARHDVSHAAVTPRMEGPSSDKPTFLASPQARDAPTEAQSKPDSSTNPYGPQVLDGPKSIPRPAGGMTVRIGQAHTFQDGAPAPMTVLPNLSPQPPMVDRRAETHVSAPEPVTQGPQHDTVMMQTVASPSAPPPQPPPPPPTPEPGISTFAAQTTDASARSAGTRAIVLAGAAFALITLVGILVVLALHKKPSEPAVPATAIVSQTVPAPSPSPSPTISMAPVETATATAAAAATATATATAPTATATAAGKPTAKPTATKTDPLHVGSGL